MIGFLTKEAAAEAALDALWSIPVAARERGEWYSILYEVGGRFFFTTFQLGGQTSVGQGALEVPIQAILSVRGKPYGLVHNHPGSWPGRGLDNLSGLKDRVDRGYGDVWGAERLYGPRFGAWTTYGLMSDGRAVKYRARGIGGAYIAPETNQVELRHRGQGKRGTPGKRGGTKGKTAPPETSGGGPGGASTSSGDDSGSRGNDYRETGREPGGAGQTTSTGTSTGEKPTERPAGGTMGPFVRNDETFRYDPATGATVRVFTITDVATGAKTTGVETISASGQVSVNNNDSAIEAERERVRQANAEAEKKKEGDEEKDQKPPETKKKDEEEDDGSETGSGGGNNTTRVDPTGDSSGDGDSRPGQFHPNYLTMDARMMLAMADLAWRRGQGPRPPSGGPTDIWQPFKGKTSSAAPEVARSRGRMLEKSAFMDAGLLGALGRQGSHGPSDGSDQIPLTRTVGDEAEAEAAANRDDVRRMLWKKHVEPRILTASQRTRRTP